MLLLRSLNIRQPEGWEHACESMKILASHREMVLADPIVSVPRWSQWRFQSIKPISLPHAGSAVAIVIWRLSFRDLNKASADSGHRSDVALVAAKRFFQEATCVRLGTTELSRRRWWTPSLSAFASILVWHVSDSPTPLRLSLGQINGQATSPSPRSHCLGHWLGSSERLEDQNQVVAQAMLCIGFLPQFL